MELTKDKSERLVPVPAHFEQGEQTDESEAAQKIRRSISYMVEHLNEPLQVATLAAAVNVSPSHYSALFKRCTGCPPIDFLIHLRMRHACQLFDSTSLNVKEVAAELGYDDPFYFSRSFKSVNRVAPSEYRMMPEDQKDTIKNADSVVILFAQESRINQRADGRWAGIDGRPNGQVGFHPDGCRHEKNGKRPPENHNIVHSSGPNFC